jgi:predicted NACHT family NTPase
MGKLLLVFDGFDEMAASVDRQGMINNFWQLARVVVSGSKAILTCRTEHFPEAKEGRTLLGAELKASTANLTPASPQFEVLDLQQLDDEQIRQVLGARAQPATVAKICGSAQLLDLARRPVMIGYILEALPEIEAGRPIDPSRIYLYAVTRKMTRDIESDRTFTSLADKVYFLGELSWEMLSTDRITLNYREFPVRLTNLFGDLVKEQKDLDHWHYDMMGQSLLVRNADGDYTPAHRSLLEFFIAYKFAAELGILAQDFMQPAKEQSNIAQTAQPHDYTWSSYFRRTVTEGRVQDIAPLAKFEQEGLVALAQTFGRAPLAPAVSELMRSMIADGAVDQLLEVAASTANVLSEPGLVGGSAVSLLVRMDRSALRGKALQRTRLDHADLSGADLTECDLRAASLRNARISGASLERVQLWQADVSEAVLGDIRAVICVAISPDGQFYATGDDDGSV